MDPLREHRLHVTRREFFGRSACGLGTAALASLLSRDGIAWRQTRPGRAPDRRPARAAALRAEGEARHLPVPERRADARRSVRLQAEAHGAARHSRSPRQSSAASGSAR